MSTFNATVVPSRRPPAFTRNGVLFGALPAAVNTVQTYEYIQVSDAATSLGWNRAGGIGNDVKFYFHQALQSLLAQHLEPVTSLDFVRVRIEETTSVFSHTDKYVAVTRRCTYKPWADYIHTLDVEYDPEKFINLLLLHETAGLYVGRNARGPIIYDMSKLQDWYDLVVDSKNCEGLKTSIFDWGITPGATDDVWMGENGLSYVYVDPYNPDPNKFGTVANYDSNLDKDTINAVKKPVYAGANLSRIASFLIEVSRFRERCLAKFLGQSFYMLDVVKLTDLDTVRTMYQYFTQDPMAILGKIGMKPAIMVLGAQQPSASEILARQYTGQKIPQDFYEVSWADFSNVKLRFAGNSGKIYDLSIPDYLQIQLESVVWLLLLNINKIEARIGQLQTPTAQLMAQAPISWILDPYENPFLIYDKEMSDKLNEARFKNLAASQAIQPPELTRGVANVMIPKVSFDNAPKIREHLLRNITTEGGATISLSDLEGPKASSAPWLLAALAAGAAFLAMKG